MTSSGRNLDILNAFINGNFYFLPIATRKCRVLNRIIPSDRAGEAMQTSSILFSARRLYSGPACITRISPVSAGK
jgi:hypothetical protein